MPVDFEVVARVSGLPLMLNRSLLIMAQTMLCILGGFLIRSVDKLWPHVPHK
jgi:hypothetical protein